MALLPPGRHGAQASSPAVKRTPWGALAGRGATVFSFDALGQQGQGMDALSSQATVSGYRAGLTAADTWPIFPMFMTAAGTVPPVKVLVMKSAWPACSRSPRRDGGAR